MTFTRSMILAMRLGVQDNELREELGKPIPLWHYPVLPLAVTVILLAVTYLTFFICYSVAKEILLTGTFELR